MADAFKFKQQKISVDEDNPPKQPNFISKIDDIVKSLFIEALLVAKILPDKLPLCPYCFAIKSR